MYMLISVALLVTSFLVNYAVPLPFFACSENKAVFKIY